MIWGKYKKKKGGGLGECLFILRMNIAGAFIKMYK